MLNISWENANEWNRETRSKFWSKGEYLDGKVHNKVNRGYEYPYKIGYGATMDQIWSVCRYSGDAKAYLTANCDTSQLTK